MYVRHRMEIASAQRLGLQVFGLHLHNLTAVGVRWQAGSMPAKSSGGFSAPVYKSIQ